MDGMAGATVSRGVLHLDKETQPWVTSVAQVRQVVPDHDPEAALRAVERLLAVRLHHAGKLRALRDSRRITGPELVAAHEIGIIVEWSESARSIAPMVRTQFRERLAGSTSDVPELTWLWKLEASHTRYEPWKEWARGQAVKGDATLADLTMLFVVEDLGVQQVADRMRMHRHRALRLLRSSLHDYALRMGKQEGDAPPEKIA